MTTLLSDVTKPLLILLFFVFCNGITCFANLFFPSQIVPGPAVSHFVKIDWNGDSFPDLVTFYKRWIPLPSISQPLSLILNDRRGGIAEVWTVGNYDSWSAIEQAELDGQPPYEILAVTEKGIQWIEILSDKTLLIHDPLYEADDLNAVHALDEDRDGITETFVLERNGDPATMIMARLNSTRDALVEDSELPIPSPPYDRMLQCIEGIPRFSVSFENANLTWQDLQDPMKATTLIAPFYGLTLLDWDGDGIDDLLGSIGGLVIFRGLPEGGFDTGYNPQDQFVNPTPQFPAGGKTVIGDLNEDGRTDTVTVHSEYSHPMPSPLSVSVAFGKGSQSDVVDYEWSAGQSDGFSIHAFLFDFNRNGHLDLLLTNASGPSRFYGGRGDGTFEEVVGLGTFPYTYTIPQLANFNGDEFPDFAAIASSPDSTVSPMVYITLGRENLKFETYSFAYIYPVRQYWGVMYNPTVQVGDVDGDGLDDILFDRSNLWINRWEISSGLWGWERCR